MTKGTLYLVPNLLGATAPEAVLPQVTLNIARRLTHWIVETPKPARAFLKSLALNKPVIELSIQILPENPNGDALDALLTVCREGGEAGLLSDAGCPCIADPGAPLVACAHRHGIAVHPLVGPSSLLLALMASGMNGQRFAFHGYLPVAENARAEALRRIERESRDNGQATQIFIETPYRNTALLNTAIMVLRDETLLCVAADLTTVAESVVCQTVRDWRGGNLSLYRKCPTIFLLQAVCRAPRA
ncbi:MAG: SAM-dependent methyltransferase [Burkholderiales bacterium]|nr:SAM-dependent methyltransferase [Burkholderiales bacterium]